MARMGNRVYGCDDCLAVCPWTKFTKRAEETDFRPRPHMAGPRLAELAGLDEAAFRAMTTGSAVKRPGRERFVRNVLIAIGNSQDESLAPLAAGRLADASPLIREAARWAIKRLAQP
jgi:epoxyqueuosine reductase